MASRACSRGMLEALSITTLEFPKCIENVVPADRGGVAPARQQHVEDLLRAGSEHHLGANQIKLPHAAEALVVYLSDASPVLLEAHVPLAQGHRIVQPQELAVGHPEPVALDGREHLRKRR